MSSTPRPPHPEEAWEAGQALTTAETQGKVAALGANIPSRVSQEALDAFLTFTPPANNQAFLNGIAGRQPDRRRSAVGWLLARSSTRSWARPSRVFDRQQPVAWKTSARPSATKPTKFSPVGYLFNAASELFPNQPERQKIVANDRKSRHDCRRGHLFAGGQCLQWPVQLLNPPFAANRPVPGLGRDPVRSGVWAMWREASAHALMPKPVTSK
jgi:hypothetical protein